MRNFQMFKHNSESLIESSVISSRILLTFYWMTTFLRNLKVFRFVFDSFFRFLHPASGFRAGTGYRNHERTFSPGICLAIPGVCISRVNANSGVLKTEPRNSERSISVSSVLSVLKIFLFRVFRPFRARVFCVNREGRCSCVLARSLSHGRAMREQVFNY